MRRPAAVARPAITPSRRDVLIGGAALGSVAALAPLAARRAFAAGHSFPVGDAEVTIVSDGNLVARPAQALWPEAPKAEFEALMQESGLPLDEVQPACNVTVLRTGDRLVVFDTGAGPRFLDTTGKLAENLAAAGIDPAAVTDVVLTHGHPDHLWGVLDEFDEELFAAATYHAAQPEFAFWTAADTLDKLPEAQKAMGAGAQRSYAAIEARLELFQPGAEVLPGVMAVESFGHTPGHCSFELRYGGEGLLIGGDVLHHPAVSFAHPEWPLGFDHERDQAIATRKKLLDRLAAEKLHLVGFHLPYPGIGYAERKDAGYRFVPG